MIRFELMIIHLNSDHESKCQMRSASKATSPIHGQVTEYGSFEVYDNRTHSARAFFSKNFQRTKQQG
jgi:hypothetical protein